METGRRYRLVRAVGSGGMAQVYEAVAEGAAGFERRVAIKRVLPQHAADPTMRRMFLDEARIQSRLYHGGIVQVLDYGLVDGDEFLAMEYVDGLDARRATRLLGGDAGGMPEGVALHVVAEIAHALDYLHREAGSEHAVVHRDVSPQNVLLSWNGDVKLSDFGIAIAAGREEKTATGVIKGKSGYIAPEQRMGKAATAASDVYALGATLHALVTGTAPFAGDDDDGFGGALTELRLDERLSPDVRALVESATAREAGARPSAADLAKRAGELASTQLRGGGRDALCELLEPLRADVRRASALDDMMGMCLVPLGGEERSFTVERTDPAPEPLATPAAKQTDVLVEPARPAAARRALWPPLAALGAVAFVLVSLRGSGCTRESVAPAFVPGVPSAAPRGGVASGVAAVPSAPPRVVEPPAGTGATPPGARAVGSSAAAAGGAAPAAPGPSASASAAFPAAGASSAPSMSGWIRIGGATLAGSRVEIDGAPAGFAPLETQLRVGNHRIVARDPATGSVRRADSVTIGEQNTRRNPVKLIQ